MANSINWFEIPASNFERAVTFYATIMDSEIQTTTMQNTQMGFFNATDGGVGGAVCYGEWYTPSADGTIPYLNGGDNLSTILDRVEAAGGTVTMPKMKVSDEVGFVAFFLDSEGNRIALHSPN